MPRFKNVNGVVIQLTAEEETIRDAQEAQAVIDQAEYDALEWKRNRENQYPSWREFTEAYTEKEIGGNSTKWDAYVTKYNLVRSNNPKP